MLLQLPVLKTGKNGVSDYNNFVKLEDEIWIKKINQKLTRSAYVTHGQFREDMHQILKNAVTYNQSTGMCAHPGPLFFSSASLFWHSKSVISQMYWHHNITATFTTQQLSAHRSEVEVCLKAILLLICHDNC